MPNHYFYLFVAALFVSTMTACSSSSSDSSAASGGGRCGPVLPIAPAEVLSGRLEEGDCTAEEIYPVQSSGDASFLDEYSITLPSTGTLTISMTSEQVDPFLFLVSRAESCSAGCDASIIITSDDNSGGMTTAFISMDLAAGTYGIQANSLGPTPGDYGLQTTFTP
jgi:hypothetical protein